MWPAGATLVGGLEWNCTDEEGQPAPFYRRLLRVLPGNESSDVIMETHHRELAHCFRGAKISFKSALDLVRERSFAATDFVVPVPGESILPRHFYSHMSRFYVDRLLLAENYRQTS